MSRWRSRMHTARHLPAGMAFAIAAEIGLRILGLPALARLAGVELDTTGASGSVAVPHARLGPADAARYRAAQRVLQRWPFGRSGQCLRLTLTAGRLLRHRKPRLCLGVSPRGSRTVAHAWLVVDDMVFDPDAALCVRLVRPPS